MGDVPVIVHQQNECTLKARGASYTVESGEMLYLVMATLELGIQLRNDFVGQHCRDEWLLKPKRQGQTGCRRRATLTLNATARARRWDTSNNAKPLPIFLLCTLVFVANTTLFLIKFCIDPNQRHDVAHRVMYAVI